MLGCNGGDFLGGEAAIGVARVFNLVWPASRNPLLNPANLGNQSLGCFVFLNVASRAHSHCLPQECRRVKLAHDEKLRLGRRVLDQADGVEAIHDGHGYVEQDKVGIVLSHSADGIASVGGLAHDFDIGLALEDVTECGAH
jgi:hypothetical protein